MSIAIKTPSIGLKGEFRVVVKDADTEEVRFDIGRARSVPFAPGSRAGW